MSEVTIIIPNYNGKALLENCIKTLERQTVRDFKLLVVDNGSTDGSTQVTSEILSMQIIALKENTGFCGAVNLGIRKTDTPYVILLNNDTEVEPNFVEELLRGIKKGERIFSCSAQMLDYKDHRIVDNAGDVYTLFGWAIARGKEKPATAFLEEANIFSSCGGASIYRTKLLHETGLLDEMHFAYLEDVDLGYRAKIYGYVNRYVPSAKVYHLGSATTGSRYNQKKVALAARNSIYVIYKNMPLLQCLINIPFLLTGILVKWLFFSQKGYGRQYIGGVLEGVRTCHKCRKVPFHWTNSCNYLRIEWELIQNIFQVLSYR